MFQLTFRLLSAVLVFCITFFAPLAPVFARSEPIEVITPSTAWSRFLSEWEDYQGHLERLELSAAKESLERALSSKYDGGLGDLVAPAVALIRQAERFHKNGDAETSAYLARTAGKLAPGSVQVHLCLARFSLGGGPMDPAAALKHYVAAVRSMPCDFSFVHRAAGRAAVFPLVFLVLFGTVFVLILLARYGRLLVHDLSDFFPPESMPGPLVWLLGAVFLLLPLCAGLSLWWLVSWWALVFSLYMQRGEALLAGLWFVLLAGSPFLVSKYADFAAQRADPVMLSVMRVRDGVPGPEDREVLEKALDRRENDPLVRLCLAELLKRQGRFYRAESLYKSLFEHPLAGQAAYNNVAEIYLAAGKLDSAHRALLAAAGAGPPRVETLYNLAQYYNEAEELLRVKEQYEKAQAIDREKLDLLRERGGVRKLNRFMAAIPVPWELLWERSLRGSAAGRAAAAGFWIKYMGPPGGISFSIACLGCFLVLVIMRVLRPRLRLSCRCASCGEPVCFRCRRPAKDPSLCPGCYSVFRGGGGVDLKIKMQKRAQVQRYRDLWRRLGTAFALAAPGTGQLLLGFNRAGALLFGAAVLVVAGLLSRLAVWPAGVASYSGGFSGHLIAPALVYAALMLVSILSFRSRAEKWR